MARRHTTAKKPQKKETKRKKAPDKAKFLNHPQYGKIPLIDVTYVDYHQKVHTVQVIDIDYQPKLIPYGAVRGNPRKQTMFSAFPKYFYEDESKECIQCGNEFIFSAKEQKYWYEDLGFCLYAKCQRCKDCRRLKKNKVALNKQLMLAQANLDQEPNNPGYMLELAEAICAYYEAYQQGRISHAISLTRKARKQNERLVEGIYWEAKALKLSGNEKKAKALFKTFIEQASSVNRCQKLVSSAKALV
jgi:hypothetical protein